MHRSWRERTIHMTFLMIRRFAAIAMALFVIDWVVGAMIVGGVLPGWAFVVVNPPFGLLDRWFESHWTGTQYLFSGRPVGDGVALLVMPLVAGLQAALFVGLWTMLGSRRRTLGASRD